VLEFAMRNASPLVSYGFLAELWQTESIIASFGNVTGFGNLVRNNPLCFRPNFRTNNSTGSSSLDY